jgi:predicted ATPase
LPGGWPWPASQKPQDGRLAFAGRSLVLTSNRAPQDWYPLFPNPVVAESLLDRLINNSHQVFMNGPSYRPRKRPGQRVTTTTKEATQ